MIIRLPIDIKSLYANIKNDNKSGHTATVATPLRQGASIHEELARIVEIPEGISQFTKEEIATQILSKSRAEAIIPNIFVFNRIAVNGIEINEIPCFCMYIREETDSQNVHCGRQKVHYPPSLNYSDVDIEIDNKKVMTAISNQLHDYAFIVEAFEYDTDSGVLNFDVLVVGENGIPYSKVFLNKKGTGNKFTAFFTESVENYDTEIIALRDNLGYDAVGPENYQEVQAKNKELAYKVVIDELNAEGKKDIRCLADDYPYSLYDFEVRDGQKKEYVIVRHTATKLSYFQLPYGKIKFCMDFQNEVKVILVNNINDNPKVEWFTTDNINMMNKSINSVIYEKRG